MKNKPVDVVYVIASKLGSIGIGTIGYNAVNAIDKGRDISYRIFCRGYDPKLDLNKKSVSSYGFLELLSLGLRFLQKKIGLNINPFKYINYYFGKLIEKNLPKSKIYHTWINISPESIKKAKKNGSILILEGANSFPLNMNDILNKEFNLLKTPQFLQDRKKLEEEIKIYKKFDYVTCPSEFVYESYIKYGFSEDKLIKMPYGVDLDKFKVREKRDNTFRAIFVGSIQVRKGVHYLLKAWDELNLKDAELIIVGRVWPDSIELVKKYKNIKSIKFIGFEKTPHKYLNNADVFISPSLEEGSALTCYEAMATGLPLIATYNTGSVARDGKDGFIIPIRDTKVLKEKIKYLYNNPKVSRKMGLSARKRVEEFSWENYSKKLAKTYKEILNEKGNKS